MLRKRRNAGIYWDEKTNATHQLKQTIQLEEIKQNVQSKDGKTKMIPRHNQTIQIKQDILKQRKKIPPASIGECTKTYQQPDVKEAKEFWSKIWEGREHNRKAGWINNMEKEGPKIKKKKKKEKKIRLDSHRTILKKYQIKKCQAIIAYMDSGFKNSLPSTTDRLSKWIDVLKKQI